MPRLVPTVDKKCPLCQEVKPLEAFYKGQSYDGGYSPYCRPCTSIMNKRHRNPERDRPRRLERYAKDKEKFRGLTRANNERSKKENPAKWRAKKFFDVHREGVASDVTREYLEELFRATTHCQCCGKVLCLEYKERESRQFRSNPDAPSVDRVNNRKGYTRANIAIICWECNFRKTDLTIEDLEMMLSYIKRNGEFDDEL